MVSGSNDQPQVVIRAVELSDAASLQANCFNATSIDEVAAMVGSALERAATDEGVSLVAAIDGEVLGNVMVTRNGHRLERHRAHLGGFILHPRLRSTGTARLLTEAAAGWAARRGCDILELDCRGGTPAEAAYRGLGFREWGRLPAGFIEDAGTFDHVRFYLETEPWLTGINSPTQDVSMPDQEVVRLGHLAVAAYQPAGTPVVAWLQGSAARRLTPAADLDVVVVWNGAVPPAHLRAPWNYSDRDFHLDRTLIDGVRVEVLHRTVDDVDRLVAAMQQASHRTAGAVDPLAAAAGLVDSQYLVGDDTRRANWLSRLTPVPEPLVSALCSRAHGDAARRLEELEWSVRRGDHYAFEVQLVTALGEHVLPALFAAHDGYYPGRKWTARLFSQLRPPAELLEAYGAVTGPAGPERRLRGLRALYDWIGERVERR